jgi:hypothetical protein
MSHSLEGGERCDHLVVIAITPMLFQYDYSLLDIADGFQAVWGRVPGQEHSADRAQPSRKFSDGQCVTVKANVKYRLRSHQAQERLNEERENRRIDSTSNATKRTV